MTAKMNCPKCKKEVENLIYITGHTDWHDGHYCEDCNPYREQKQMGGEWFEWNENEWVNVTKSMRLKVEDMSDWEFKVPENLDWRVQGEKGYGFYFIRDFSTKDEALTFARDFMVKNGGIIE